MLRQIAYVNEIFTIRINKILGVTVGSNNFSVAICKK